MKTDADQTVRIAIFLASTGDGHRSVAEAVREALESTAPHAVQVDVLDFFSTFNVPVLRKAPQYYSLLSSKALWLYNLLWRLTDRRPASRILATLTYFLARRRLAAYLTSEKPQIVVSVHPLYIADVVSRARGKLHMSFGIASIVCDPVMPHASWASEGSDIVFSPTDTAARRLMRFGTDPGRIEIVGFPIRRALIEAADIDKSSAKAQLGLRGNAHLIVLSGGGVGVGNLDKKASFLSKTLPGLQVLVLAGRNRRLLGRLRKYKHGNIHVKSFVCDVATIYAAADVVISKAGPSTIFEVAHVGRPLLLTEEVGIQEKGNIEMAERLGIAKASQHLNLLADDIREALTSPRPPTSYRLADRAPGSRIAETLLRISGGVSGGTK